MYFKYKKGVKGSFSRVLYKNAGFKVLRVFQECFKEILKKINGCYNNLSSKMIGSRFQTKQKNCWEKLGSLHEG